MTEKYQVTGMSCASCSARVEKAVSKLPGVRTASVNLLMNNMTVDYDESVLKQADIIQAVVNAGYGASPISDAPAPGAPAAAAPQPLPDNAEELKNMKTRLIASVCFLLPLMYIAMGGMMGLPLPSFLSGMEHSLINAFTQFLLCLPVVVLNRKFYKVGFRALWHRAPNMDSLIAVGSGAALLSGVIGIYRMAWAQTTGDMELFHQSAHQLYLESAAMILTLITLGKYLETRSKGRTGEAISRLIALTPETASLLKEDGTEVETPVSQVVPGDIAVVRAGQRIPVDGVICWGTAAVDESALTGESGWMPAPSAKTASSASGWTGWGRIPPSPASSPWWRKPPPARPPSPAWRTRSPGSLSPSSWASPWFPPSSGSWRGRTGALP